MKRIWEIFLIKLKKKKTWGDLILKNSKNNKNQRSIHQQQQCNETTFSSCSPTIPLPLPPQDFILISEFSELEGPLPLAVVSEQLYFDLKDPEQSTKALHRLGLEQFDFNAFVLRIVSVDQTSEQFE